MAKVIIIGAGGVGRWSRTSARRCPRCSRRSCWRAATKSKCDAIAASQIARPIATAQVDADNVAETGRADPPREAGPGDQRGAALPGPADHGRLPRDRRRLPRHRQLRAAGRGQVRVQMAVGLPGPLRDARDHGPARQRLRSRRDQRLHCVRCTSTSSTRSTSSTSSTATPATTASPSPPTSTPRSTSARSRHAAATGRTGSGSGDRSAVGQHASFDFPEGIGPKKIYLMYHEELESLVKHFPRPAARPLLDDFSDNYLTHLKVLQNVGMTRHRPGRSTRAGNRPAAVPQGAAARPGDAGPADQGQDLHRLPGRAA